MTEFEEWLEGCKNRLKPPRPANTALDLLLEDFPKALRMLEVAVYRLEDIQEEMRLQKNWLGRGGAIQDTLNKINSIAKEQDG